MIEHVDTVMVLAQLPPNPAPIAPPGSGKIIELVGQAKWGAGFSLLLGFFIGLIVWAGGRWVDHHRAGRIGLVMMLCAVAGGLLYGIGYQVIEYFARSG